MTLAVALAPILHTAIILVVLAAIGNLINLFLKKTSMGNRIMARTPWMGWYSDVNEDYTNFTIHPANYYHPQSSNR